MRLISLVILLVACGRDAPAPDAQQAKVTVAPTVAPTSAPTGAPKDTVASKEGGRSTLAAPQQAAPRGSLIEALTAAEGCVIEGRPRRGCLAYDRLMEAVRAPANAAWFEQVLTQAGGPAGALHTRLALALLADGAIQGPSERFVATLLPLTNSLTSFVRAHAMRALALHDGPGVVERALNLAEQDSDPEVRESAVLVIGNPQQARAGRAAVTTLLRVLANDKDPSVKRAAIGALGQFKPAEALPTLISLMDDPLLGPNATLEVGGYPQSAAYRAILARIAEVKEGRDLPPSTMAALGRLREHPEYDAAQVRLLLGVVRPFVEKDGSPTGQIALELLKNHLEGMAAAPASEAPVSGAPASAAPVSGAPVSAP